MLWTLKQDMLALDDSLISSSMLDEIDKNLDNKNANEEEKLDLLIKEETQSLIKVKEMID